MRSIKPLGAMWEGEFGSKDIIGMTKYWSRIFVFSQFNFKFPSPLGDCVVITILSP